MTINAQGYFNALRSYLNTDYYEVTEVDEGQVVLKDNIYLQASQRPVVQRVRLRVPGSAIVIRVDTKNKRGNSEGLFHFLDDDAKPWSRRCDFVVFHLHRDRLTAVCIEFKSTTFTEALVDQLKANEALVVYNLITLCNERHHAKQLHLAKYVSPAVRTRHHIWIRKANVCLRIIRSSITFTVTLTACPSMLSTTQMWRSSN